MSIASCEPQALSLASSCFECIPLGEQQAVETYILAQLAHTVAGTSTDPNELSLASACFLCLQGMNQDVQLYLMCRVNDAGGTGVTVGIDCDPGALANAARCFWCITAYQHQAIQTYLWAHISNEVAGTSLDPNELAKQSACMACMIGINQDVQIYLLCQLAGGGSGGDAGTITGFAFAYVNGTSGGTTAVASWDAPPSGVTGTEVWVSTDGVTYVLSGTVASPGTSLPEALVAEGIVYAKARWVNASNQGAFSSVKFLTYRVGEWAARIITNGGVAISQAQMDASNTYVKTTIDHSQYSRILSMIIPAIGNLISGTTPLFKTIGPNIYVNHNFVDGDFTVNGGTSNGTSKYVDMGITPADICNALGGGNFPKFGISVYENDAVVANDNAIGSRTSAGNFDTVSLAPRFGDGNSYFNAPYAGTQIFGAQAGYGLFIGSRTSTTAAALYIYNSGGLFTVGTTANNVGAQVPNTFNLYGWTMNTNNSPEAPTVRRFALLAAHDGFNAADALIFGQDIQAFLTALGCTVV